MVRASRKVLHRHLAKTIAALVRPRLIILRHPDIEILLQFADRRIDLLAEGDAVELVEHGLVKPLDDAIGLRALGLGAAMVDVLDGKIELIFVMLWIAAIFRAPIGKNTLQHDAVLLVEGQDPVVQEIGGHDRRLAIIELGEANLRIGIDEGLLIDADDAFQATFLVLVRKARSVRVNESLAPWLYRVAFRTAQRARTMGSRFSQGMKPIPSQNSWHFAINTPMVP